MSILTFPLGTSVAFLTIAVSPYLLQCRVEALAELEVEGLSTAELNVTDEGSIKAAVEKIHSAEGRIDMLICNAGILVPARRHLPSKSPSSTRSLLWLFCRHMPWGPGILYMDDRLEPDRT